MTSPATSISPNLKPRQPWRQVASGAAFALIGQRSDDGDESLFKLRGFNGHLRRCYSVLRAARREAAIGPACGMESNER